MNEPAETAPEDLGVVVYSHHPEHADRWFAIPVGYTINRRGRKFLVVRDGNLVGEPYARKRDALRAAHA